MSFTQSQFSLIAGDIIALSVVTLIGFNTHDTLGSGRFLATLVPLVFSWVLICLYGGTFKVTDVSDISRLWRPVFAMILIAPMAVWLRSLWLGTTSNPIFVIVLGGFSALGILVWRGIFIAWMKTR